MRKLLPLALLLVLMPVLVFAQPVDTLPVVPWWQQIIEALIPVLTMLMVWFARWFVPKIPPIALPVLAATVGALLDYIQTLITHGGFSVEHGLLLGAAAVFLREFLTTAGFRVSVAAGK